jgi:putative SOS response-associated peptidase YedK
VHLLNTEVFAVAGLHEFWPGRDGAAPIASFTIITTEANGLIRPLHDRMPAILHESDYEAWLAPQDRDPAALQALLAPYPAEEMRAYPVSPRVNNAKNDGPELIEETGESRGTLL